MRASARLAKCINLFRVPELLAIVVCAAVIFGAAFRFIVDRDVPLWIDEAWTGAIAGQATFRATIDQSLLDANAPAYFLLMHFWTKLFGLSDAALRFPSFIFGAIAPLVALVQTKGMERNVRLLWCGIVALWVPGIYYSHEARCYSLAFLLAMACTLAYVRLLAQPDIRATAVWALFGSLAILTHYHALLLVGCQGIGYLAVHRNRALRTWPAALLFLPAFAWIAVHAPRLLQYADPSLTFHQYIELSKIPAIIEFVAGSDLLAAELLIIGTVLGILDWRSHWYAMSARVPDVQTSAWLAAGTSVIAGIIFVTTGWPFFALRYLMVFMPGVLLCIALIAARFGRRWTLVPVGTVLLFGIYASAWSINESGDVKQIWNFEQASRELENRGIDRLVFLFDNPLTKVFELSQLEALGGFYFRRRGLTIPVTPIILRSGEDPNERVLASATSPRSAILWLYDLTIPGTAAASHPPRIEQIDHTWVCSSFDKGLREVMACHRR